jgi:kynurenine formamidase
VSLALPLATEAGLDHPEPAEHRMTLLHDVDIGSGTVRFAKDFVGVNFHSDGHSHVDAFSHVAFDGRIYGGHPAGSVTSRGAGEGSIALLRDGLVGRGVLLDVPRTRRVPWLEPGEHVTAADLAAAERAQGVTVTAGDILLVRTGHTRRLAELPPWDTGRAKAGLHPFTARFLADRGVAALGSDGNNDTAPSDTEGIAFPVHVLAVNAMGLHLLDYLNLEEVAVECERAGRWEFLFVAAPLRITRGTGSPVNPLAIF